MDFEKGMTEGEKDTFAKVMENVRESMSTMTPQQKVEKMNERLSTRKGRLGLHAAMMNPLPRMMMCGESMQDAQIREFISSRTDPDEIDLIEEILDED